MNRALRRVCFAPPTLLIKGVRAKEKGRKRKQHVPLRTQDRAARDESTTILRIKDEEDTREVALGYNFCLNIWLSCSSYIFPSSAEKTINAEFVIDPARNGGVAHQYDEVVRTRNERRQMDAGDCECCRDVRSLLLHGSLHKSNALVSQYYEAIGPLPNRLQQPLWRSPSATPVKPCQRHSRPPENEWQPTPQEIDSHKKAISRHRHTWARPNTPPDYWNIGFPDTQEAGAINERADEMHRRKRAEVEKVAMVEAGRYRRR